MYERSFGELRGEEETSKDIILTEKMLEQVTSYLDGATGIKGTFGVSPNFLFSSRSVSRTVVVVASHTIFCVCVLCNTLSTS